MHIICLDLEGVLIPEIWHAVAKKYKLKELLLSTRDEPNYDKLMRYRINILKREKIKLGDIQKIIGTLKPLPGAKSFLKKLQAHYPVTILSDTFYEFAMPLMKQLDYPNLFCNWLKVNKQGYITSHVMRQQDGKRKAVKAFKSAGFKVKASGDSYNDLTMLASADKGVLFKPPASIVKKYKKYPVTRNYNALLKQLLR